MVRVPFPNCPCVSGEEGRQPFEAVSVVPPLRVWVVAPVYCILKLSDEDFKVSIFISGVKFLDPSQVSAAEFQGFPVVGVAVVRVIFLGVSVPGLI